MEGVAVIANVPYPLTSLIHLSTYTYTYDPAHRLQSVTDSRGLKRLTYGYTPGGQVVSLQDSDGGHTDYAYDAVGRLAAIWAPNGDTVSVTSDPAGRLTEKALMRDALK